LHIARLTERIKDKRMAVELTKGGLDYLAKVSYDAKYGARPVRRKIQDLVEDPFTQKFLEGEFKEGDAVKIDANKKKDGINLVKKT